MAQKNKFKDPPNQSYLDHPGPPCLVSGHRTSFKLCKTPVWLSSGNGQTNHREVTGPGFQNQFPFSKTQLPSCSVRHAVDRSADCNR